MVEVNKKAMKLVSSLFLMLFIQNEICAAKISHKNRDVPIEEVHIVFMNHLDVGYDGVYPEVGFINNILNMYFTLHFPRAVNLSQSLRSEGYVESFIYTTHPWLVSLYVNCPENFTLSGITLKCPSEQDRDSFIAALQQGDITYHAGPMNMQPENADQMLFELSLNISENLDTMFNIKRQYRTLSQRDVPGMTIAVVPTLVKKNIAAVTVGVNDGTSAPAVPKIFTWRFDDDNEVIAMWNPGGYPDNPGPYPSDPRGISKDHCVIPPNFNKAMCFSFRTDNSGPPMNIQEILSSYEILRREFPGAKLFASTFEKFVEAVQPIKSQLPVITQEIGDTWISGIASDPRKMAEYRVVTQTLTACIKEGRCDTTDKRIMDSVFYMIKPGEHTWGLPGLGDLVNWTNEAFTRARTGQNYINCEQSWLEQRQFVDLAIQELGDHPVAMEMRENLKELTPALPNLDNYETADPSKVYSYTDGTKISFGKDGSVNHLFDPFNKKDWATSGMFGKFLYWSYNETDYNITDAMYHWDGALFNKYNLTVNANPKSTVWPTMLNALYKAKDGSFSFLVQMLMMDPASHFTYGAPGEMWVEYVYRDSKVQSPPGFQTRLLWFYKTTTRLPESLMFYFSPLPPIPPPPPSKKQLAQNMEPDYQFKLRKLGYLVDPANIILNGSIYLHAIDSEVQYTDAGGSGLRVMSQDVPLVSLSTIQTAPSPFPVPLQPIEQGQISGFAFNIYNNMWDTNYIMWYPYLKEDQNFSARFFILFDKK